MAKPMRRIFSRLIIFPFSIAFPIWLPSVALAHPHVFVDVGVSVGRSDNGSVFFDMRWSFDELFSSQIIDSCDTDRNRSFSNGEVLKVDKTFFSYLKNYNYFLNIKIDGKTVSFKVENFKAQIENGSKVIYEFKVISEKAGLDLNLRIKDPTNFTAFLPGEKIRFLNVKVAGSGISSIECEYNITFKM